ncbi:MAG TPA: hypothetical protein VD970_03745 [Acetobacteraceae bacterium]|nr:hypothetical protein [Acetobacteraceae bacterium]
MPRRFRWPRRLPRSPLALLFLLGLILVGYLWPQGDLAPPATGPRPGDDPGWIEPPATLDPTPTRLADCRAVDGDTLHCTGIRVRLRGVDTPERGEPNHREATRALQAMVASCRRDLVLIPRHRSHDRIVGNVLCGDTDLGHAMDAAGWSKPEGARR